MEIKDRLLHIKKNREIDDVFDLLRAFLRQK